MTMANYSHDTPEEKDSQTSLPVCFGTQKWLGYWLILAIVSFI